MNHITSSIVESLGASVGLLEILNVTSGIASAIEIDVNYKLWIPLSLVMILFLGLEIFMLYVFPKFQKKECPKWNEIINVVAVTSLPITIGLIASLVVGLIYPPILIGVFVCTLIVHTLFLYKSIKLLNSADNEPIISFAIIMFILSIVVTLIGCETISYAMSGLFEGIMDSISSLGEGLSGLLQ